VALSLRSQSFLFLSIPVVMIAFLLLNTASSIQPTEQKEQDADNDLISDAYELFFGLNPVSNDAGLDYDGDALLNIEEGKILTDPFEPDTDRDLFPDDFDEVPISRAYLQWGNPHFTTGDEYEYAHPNWLLGAYKNGGEWIYDPETTQSCWYVSGHGGKGVDSLSIDLDRTILTNNLRHAVRLGRAAQPVWPSDSLNVASREYGDGTTSSRSVWPEVSIDLLDTNGMVIAENLFGNLLSVSNMTRDVVIPAEAGIQSNSAILLLNIPTEKFPSAAVIQLRCKTGELAVYEGLLYIDEDGDGLDADQERQLNTSDYSIDSNNNGTNDYDECFNSGSSTNNPGGGGGGDDGDDHDGDGDEENKKKGVIYVDQAKGNDNLTGRAPDVSANKKGPKKTVHGGLSIAETNDTIIIRSGTYNENLNIQGKDVKVIIEGKVRL